MAGVVAPSRVDSEAIPPWAATCPSVSIINDRDFFGSSHKRRKNALRRRHHVLVLSIVGPRGGWRLGLHSRANFLPPPARHHYYYCCYYCYCYYCYCCYCRRCCARGWPSRLAEPPPRGTHLACKTTQKTTRGQGKGISTRRSHKEKKEGNSKEGEGPGQGPGRGIGTRGTKHTLAGPVGRGHGGEGRQEQVVLLGRLHAAAHVRHLPVMRERERERGREGERERERERGREGERWERKVHRKR